MFEDIPGWPFFGAFIGECDLCIAFHPTDDEFVVKTYEGDTLGRCGSAHGADYLWSLLLRLIAVQGIALVMEDQNAPVQA